MSTVIDTAAANYVPFGDGRIYQRPTDSRDAEKPRYLFSAGSLIDPQRARQYPYLKAGGMEISNPCLRFVKRFIRRGRITPLLEDTHDPIPREMVDPQDTSYFDLPAPPNHMGPSPLMGKRVLPGHQIDLILSGPENIHQGTPRGLVEIRTLKHHPYNPVDVEGGLYLDPTIWEIQRAFFPEYPILPKLLRELKSTIDKVRSSEYLGPIAEDKLVSCEQFERFAVTSVERAHMEMRHVAATANGYVPTYTAIDLHLLDQLGLARQDEEFKQLAQHTQSGTGANQIGEIKELFSMFLEANREERAELIKAFDNRAKQVVVGPATMMAAEPEPELPIVTEPVTESGAESFASEGEQGDAEPVETAAKPRRRGFTGAGERIAAERAAEKG